CCDDGTLLRLLEETPEFAELLGDDVSFSGAEGEQRWSTVGEALDRSWEGVLDRFGELLDWRGETPAGEAGAAQIADTAAGEQTGGSATAATAETGDAAGTEDVESSAEGGDDAPETVWGEAGILPVELTFPTGHGYTL